MSYDFDAAATAVLNSKARGAHWLIECDFTTGIGRFTTAPIDVVSPNGFTYLGLGKGIAVEDVKEAASPDTSTLNVQISIVNKTMLALLTGDQSIYRGRSIRFILQIFDGNFKPVGQPRKRWTGVMNPIRVNREKPDEANGNTFGYIELPCTRAGLSRARHRQGLRMTHEQHIQDHPGDLFFEHMTSLIEKPTPWISIAFQRIS